MIIAVIDAQGAGIGKTVIKELRNALKSNVKIFALGTNKAAYENMKEEGADSGGYGQKYITDFLKDNKTNCIIGPIGIISSGGIQGEITPLISRLIFESECKKYIIPLNLHGLFIPGTQDLKIKDSINLIIKDILGSMT